MFSIVRQWFNPRSRHTKDFKMVLDTSLLNTQQYKVQIKGKVKHSRERTSAPQHIGVVAIESRAFWSPSNTVAYIVDLSSSFKDGRCVFQISHDWLVSWFRCLCDTTNLSILFKAMPWVLYIHKYTHTHTHTHTHIYIYIYIYIYNELRIDR